MKFMSSQKRVALVVMFIASVGIATIAAQPQGGPIAALQTAVTTLQSQVAALAAAVADLQNAGGSGATEVWKLGTPSANMSTGLLTPGNFFYCSFSSPVCALSRINAFDTISPTAKRVDKLWVTVSRAGSYGLGLTLTVEVRGFDGSLRHTVSASPVDLETIPDLQWSAMPISGSILDTEVMPGEYLAAHVVANGGLTGTLSVNLHVRAEMVNP